MKPSTSLRSRGARSHSSPFARRAAGINRTSMNLPGVWLHFLAIVRSLLRSASWAVLAIGLLLVAGCRHHGRGARYANAQTQAGARTQATVDDAQPQEVAQPQRELPQESFVVPAAYALSRGLTATAAQEAFGAGQDGTQLLVDFLKRAREAGAVYVSDIVFYFASQREEGPVECKVDVYPDDGATPQARLGQTEVVPMQRPVGGLVTEQEYRCRQ